MSVASFTKLLKNKKYPKVKEGWDIEGILHGSTNKSYKYDLSPIRKFEDKTEGKIGFFDTKAEILYGFFSTNPISSTNSDATDSILSIINWFDKINLLILGLLYEDL